MWERGGIGFWKLLLSKVRYLTETQNVSTTVFIIFVEVDDGLIGMNLCPS